MPAQLCEGKVLLVESFYNRVTDLVGLGKPVDGIFLDLSKTLDTVSRKILLDKMSNTQLDNPVT